MAAADIANVPAAVVSRDTDVLVILLAKLTRVEVIRVQPQPGKPAKLIKIEQVKTDLGPDLYDVLLPLHAMTGFDTTSAPFRSYRVIFNKKKRDKVSIAEAGEKLMIVMYNVKQLNTLDMARYFRLRR